jgi:hypothetical protein
MALREARMSEQTEETVEQTTEAETGSGGNGKFTLQLGEYHYNIVAPDGTWGDLVTYGDLATLTWGGRIYAAFVADGDDAEGGVLGARIYELTEAEAKVEEVEYEDQEEPEVCEECGQVIPGEDEEDNGSDEGNEDQE